MTNACTVPYYLGFIRFVVLFRSTSFVNLDRPVAVPYTQGNWQGTLGTDLIRFIDSPNATVNVNVALIKSSENFFINGSNWEGILGLGYAHLSKVCIGYIVLKI